MLKNIKLTNFRNHSKFELDLERITIIIGPNGVGKSNILEAVGMLSFCRSFREDDRRNLIAEGQEYSRIEGDSLEFFMQRSPRLSVKVKEKGSARKSSEFIGILPSVIFSPETMAVVTGTPGERRRFLDSMISQEDKDYYEALIAFNKVRKQRNNLLERIATGQASAPELDFWNSEFVRYANILERKREEAIKYINQYLSGLYQDICGGEAALSIEYLKSSEGDLLQKIEVNKRREISAGNSLYGPHRDDLEFLLNGKNAANFASRGEIRSVTLALKVGELKFIEESNKKSIFKKAKYSPILLLDDVFSEFDPSRRSHLGMLIDKYQALITTTEIDHLSSDLIASSKVVELK